jgi:GxxExxY protein
MSEIKVDYFPSKDETEKIIHYGLEVHSKLGFGFLEAVYKDALEFEFELNDIPFTREKEYEIYYKGSLLNHRFYADFVVFDSVILEVKAKSDIASIDVAQAINYLSCSGCKVGLILNFGKEKLQMKRLLL